MSNICTSVWSSPKENIPYEFVLATPAVSCIYIYIYTRKESVYKKERFITVWYLFISQLRWCVAQVKVHMISCARNSWPRQHSPTGAPHAPSNKRNPAEAGENFGVSGNGYLRSISLYHGQGTMYHTQQPTRPHLLYILFWKILLPSRQLRANYVIRTLS